MKARLMLVWVIFNLFSVLSPPPRRARALYACKAEHDSELSFIAGTVFENGEFLTTSCVALAGLH